MAALAAFIVDIYSPSHPDVSEDEIDYNIPRESPGSLKRSIPPASTGMASTTAVQKVTSLLHSERCCYVNVLFSHHEL